MRQPRIGTILNHLALVIPLGLCFAADADELGGDVDIDMEVMASRKAMPSRHEVFTPFQLFDRAIGGARAPESIARPASLAGSPIAALDKGALVVDADSGELALLDDEERVLARVDIGVGATQVVWDANARLAYAVDRRGDRVVVVKTGDESLKILRSIETGTEPYGIALTPDGTALLVTAVVDGTLTAYDATTGKARWTVAVGQEPRGVAISPKGEQALVASLTTGALTRVSLDRATPDVELISLDPPTPAQAHMTSRVATGRAFARNSFAAIYVGHDLAFTGHQISNPDQTIAGQENRGTYGGGFAPPVSHRLTFVGPDGKLAAAGVQAHQPRALAYDPITDAAYFAGYGSDTLIAIADASQASVRFAWQVGLNKIATDPCGPNGIAIRGDQVLVSCELSRRVIRVDTKPNNKSTPSETLFATKLDESERRGRDLFRRGNNHVVSTRGAMACTSCHAEGRTDGLTWRIEGHNLQTPLLAGRLEGTHPFKWDGKDATIKDSLSNTVKRLGGTGIKEQDVKDLRAFLATIPAPRAAERNAKAVARGKKLFASKDTGCASCHSGKLFTDGKRHDLALDLDKVDTPSLIGLAVSAPYFHDGSASTLRAVLLENGTIHDMGSTRTLDENQLEDLIAYLETL